ncbi:MAG TPA: pantetheine-phosphate adenylyltransferase, partial [Reyranella sp.]|nr:pantetheine-phosphate adenylyltransferase [Reyranella sp.]
MAPATALYAGSFDPVTNGHVDIIRGACRLVEHLVLAVGVHHGKEPMLPAGDRVALLKAVSGGLATESGCRIDVITFDDLVVDAARRAGATILVRGLRDGSDLDYEMRMAGMNAGLAPDLQTVFLPASPAVRPIAATLVRQIAAMGGDISAFVPKEVADRLASRPGTKGV